MNQKKEISIVLASGRTGATVPSQHKLKWARCQGAVTIPWPRAHSILKRIGGDDLILRQLVEMSRKNHLNNCPPGVDDLIQLPDNTEDGELVPPRAGRNNFTSKHGLGGSPICAKTPTIHADVRTPSAALSALSPATLMGMLFAGLLGDLN